MASSKSTIDIIIGTVCKFTGIDAAKRALSNLASTVGKNLMNIKAGFDMARAAVSHFMSAMSKGMEFERLTVQFKSLTGSIDAAKAHMADLQELGRTPPFSIEQFAAASQQMLKMTGGMAGFKKEMEIVGDMAAATGNSIEAVGRAFGLAYQVIRDGQDFGRAGQMLYTMGVMSKKQVAEFAEMSKAGKDNAAVWNQLCEVFSRYKGAMADTEKTAKGLVDAINGEMTVAMTDLSSAVTESAKPALEGLLGYMKRINEDGTIEDWAERAAESLNGFVETAKAAIGPISKVWSAIRGLYESTAQAGGSFVGTLQGGGGIGDALKAGSSGFKQGWVDAFDSDGAEADHRASRAAEKKRKREERSAALAAEQAERQAEDLAAAQEALDRKVADEKAKADAEAAKKREAEELREIETLKKAREKAEADLHALRVKNAQDELKSSEQAASAASSTASYAQTEFDKAFGMYRSADHGAAQIAEERDYAADYKQLQKDARRSGQGWRIDELASLMAAGDTQGQSAKLEEWRKSSKFTPEVESMVRAAAADQTKTTAEDELRKINENTKNLADKLDQLLQVK